MNLALPRRVATHLLAALLALALLVSIAYLSAYFYLSSSPGQATLHALAERIAPTLTFDTIHWGPSPSRLVLGPAHLRPPATNPFPLRATALELDLASLTASPVRIRNATLFFGNLSISETPSNSLDLVDALTPPRRPAASSGTPPRPPPALTIDHFSVHIATLALDLHALDADLRDLTLTGHLTLGATPLATLSSSSSSINIATSRQNFHFDSFTFSLTAAPDALALTRLTLDRSSPPATLSAAGTLPLPLPTAPTSPLAHLTLSAALAAADLPPSLAAALPQGLTLAGLDLTLFPQRDLLPRATAHLAAITAPTVLGPGLFASDLTTSDLALSFTPTALAPEITLTAASLSAASLSALTHRAHDLRLDRLAVTSHKRLHLAFEARAATWLLPTGPIPTPTAAVTGTFKLTGGTLDTHLTSPDGDLTSHATLRMSPLTGRTDFTAEFTFDRLTAALREAFLHDLPTASRTALLGPNLATPVSGDAELELELDHDPAATPPNHWIPRTNWTSTALSGLNNLSWDGVAWDPSEAP